MLLAYNWKQKKRKNRHVAYFLSLQNYKAKTSFKSTIKIMSHNVTTETKKNRNTLKGILYRNL